MSLCAKARGAEAFGYRLAHRGADLDVPSAVVDVAITSKVDPAVALGKQPHIA